MSPSRGYHSQAQHQVVVSGASQPTGAVHFWLRTYDRRSTASPSITAASTFLREATLDASAVLNSMDGKQPSWIICQAQAPMIPIWWPPGPMASCISAREQ